MPIQQPHAQHTAMAERWKRCRDVYAGEDAVHKARETYLPAPSAMDHKEYEAYLARASFDNHLKPSVDGFLGLAFKESPAITLPEALAAHADDVTLDDTSLGDLAFRVFEELLVVSRAGILLDYSEVRARPYWVTYRAEQVLNWRVGRVRDAVTLTLVVLQESVTEDDPKDPLTPKVVEQLRVLQLLSGAVGEASDAVWQYRVSVWRKNDKGEYAPIEERVPTRRGKPLDFIPFVIVGPGGLETDVAPPVLLDLVNLNLSHYRTNADYKHALHWTANPTPWVAGAPAQDTVLKIGSSTAWVLEAGGAAGMLEYKGQGVDPLKEALDRDAERMAALGARLLQSGPGKAETAEAVRMRYSGEHARLRTIVQSASLCFSALLRWHVWWATVLDTVTPEDASVTFTEEFFDRVLSPEDAKAYVLMWTAGAISRRTLYHSLERGKATRPGVTYEQELAEILAESPEVEPEPAPEPAGATS
jgi:hypothetical protein